MTGLHVKKLTIKPSLVVEIEILTVHKSINTGHTLSNTAFQRTVNQPVMYRSLFMTIRQQIGLDI